MYAVDGRVRDVIYLGLYTRYLVELEAASAATWWWSSRTCDTTSMDVLPPAGAAVRLIWKKAHNRTVQRTGPRLRKAMQDNPSAQAAAAPPSTLTALALAAPLNLSLPATLADAPGLLLGPPLLWMGVIYLGSLAALLVNSFFHLDDFTGQVVRQFTLHTYAQLFTRANLDIVLRTAGMAAAVTLACALLAFPLAYYMAHYASPRYKGILYLAVLLPLWSSYLVRVYAWKLILAKEGIFSWFVELAHLDWLLDGLLRLPGIGGPSLSVSPIGMFIVFVYVWLPYMILPDPGGPGAGAAARCWKPPPTWARARRHLPQRDPAAGLSRRGRRLDFHLLADPGRFHRP